MATAVWVEDSGSTNTTFDATVNWSGGTAPVNNDTVIINAGARNIDTNLTTGLTGITLRIGPGFTGNIGSSTTWLDIDGGEFDFSSGGTSCYMTGEFTTVNVKNGVSSTTMLSYKGNATSVIGTLRCVGGSGTVTVGDNASLTAVEHVTAPSLKLDIGGVSDLSTVRIDGGAMEIDGNIASTVTVRGGTLTLKSTCACAGTVNLEPGGVMVHQATGGIATLNVFGGLFDARDNANSTISAFTTVRLYEGGTIDLQSGLGPDQYTFTNGVEYHGGVFLAPLGSTLTVS